jgi:hypothetical protein
MNQVNITLNQQELRMLAEAFWNAGVPVPALEVGYAVRTKLQAAMQQLEAPPQEQVEEAPPVVEAPEPETFEDPEGV